MMTRVIDDHRFLNDKFYQTQNSIELRNLKEEKCPIFLVNQKDTSGKQKDTSGNRKRYLR